MLSNFASFRSFQLELDRLTSRIAHLRSQNDVLSLALSESKNICEDLTVAIGRYESTHTAHHLAEGYADHIVDCLEAIVELRGADPDADRRRSKNHDDSGGGGGGGGGGKERQRRARKNRQAAERAARRLLQKLDEATNRPDSGLSLPSMEEGEEEATGSKWWVATVVGKEEEATEAKKDKDEEEESSGYSHTTK